MEKQDSFTVYAVLSFFALLLAACTNLTATPTANPRPVETGVVVGSPSPTSAIEAATPQPRESRLLSICLGQEPKSLFIYGGASRSARSVWEAVYDGPFDIYGYEAHPVILQEKPSLQNGSVWLEPLQVQVGDLILDAHGNWATLVEGTLYRPSGCTSESCLQTYSGNQPVSIDGMVIRFHLLPGLLWSDGAPLTAHDSVFSYQVAQELPAAYRPNVLNYTLSYQAVDEAVVEWRGVAGYINGRYELHFFTPLPRHNLEGIPAEERLSAEASAIRPVGWGPYIIEEWISGDHISFSKNPNYFRKGEDLPRFDRLVYRFVSNSEEALAALLSGECDLYDESTMIGSDNRQLLQMQEKGQVQVAVRPGTAWEQALFGINAADEQRVGLFSSKEVRQAIAMCIDRSAMARDIVSGPSVLASTYVFPDHPTFNPDARSYDFDPHRASELLTAAGWLDPDGDPSTPRQAAGVPGVPSGTEFEFNYLTPSGEQGQKAAQAVSESLSECGIRVNVVSLDLNEMLAPGPDGPVFGRNFDMAQFGWISGLEPACSLYTSDEVPGPYPEFGKGWGGANAGGFSSPEYDAACQMARSTLPEWPDQREAQLLAQSIYAEELPSIPLYWYSSLIAARIDLCGLGIDSSVASALWNLEQLDYGERCR